MPRKATCTSFKKGNVPWNKQSKKEVACLICNKKNYVIQSKEKKYKTCSRYCARTLRANGNAEKCYQLALKGYSSKQISAKLNLPMGSVSSYLNKKKYRKYPNGGEGYTAIIKRFKLKNPSCEICGFNRIVEAAHIIPASKGGAHHESNLISLCPNHHHLFDNKKLTNEEYSKIKEKINL